MHVLAAHAGLFLAQAAAPPASTGSFLLQTVAPLVMVVAVFYLLVFRPQQQRAKQHTDMITNLRRGDVVLTAGGILGKIIRVTADEATVEIAENVRVKVLKSTISEVRAKTEPAKAGEVEPKPESEPANDEGE